LTQALLHNFHNRLNAAQTLVEARLEALLPGAEGNRLAAAMRYAALGQGKRLRPFFVLESAKLFDVAEHRALDVACALECVHCYSLVHDDLPAMDNDDLRRGLPTTHRKFDEATAILAGDGLLTFAFEILAQAQEFSSLFLALAKAAGPSGMVGGQMCDIEAETTDFSSLAEISAMQRLKTGALFEFACVSGALMAGADPAPLKAYADHIGLAFQIADDILDIESTPEALGKATQKDGAKGKATFVSFLGLEGAKAEAARLVDAAVVSLKSYGKKSEVLAEAAAFIVSRRK
jgi:farnesyl diphosphate synthase